MKTQVTIMLDENVKKELKKFSIDCNISMKDVIQKAIVDLLKKNNREVSIVEMK